MLKVDEIFHRKIPLEVKSLKKLSLVFCVLFRPVGLKKMEGQTMNWNNDLTITFPLVLAFVSKSVRKNLQPLGTDVF